MEKVNIVAKPPRIYLFSILTGILLQIVWPLSIVSLIWLRILALIIIGLGIGLAIWGDREFNRQNTPVNPDHPPSSLVTSGPYRFSRNPMYVGLTALQLGLGLALNSWWLVLTLIPALVVMSRGVIDREERFMQKKFGKAYLDYKKRVRRWI